MIALSPTVQARLSTPLKIGAFEVKSRVLQSPLSGVTDLVFRRLVRRYAPDSMMYTEMVNATGLHYVNALSNSGGDLQNPRVKQLSTLR